MKFKILFMALFLMLIMGDAMAAYNCYSGNIILSTPGFDGRTMDQECIDAGYQGCEFVCCFTANCMGVTNPPCISANRCDQDIPFALFVCCGGPAEVVNETICNLVVTFWGAAAAVASLVIVLSGIKWMGSMEDPEVRRQAKTNIVNAVVGLIIVGVAIEIVNWLFVGAGSFSIFQFSCLP